MNSDDKVFECEASDIGDAMKLSWWDVTTELITICKDGNVDVTSAFYKNADTIRSTLKELTNLVRTKKGANLCEQIASA